MTTTTSFPDHTEAVEYYFIYIDQVPAGDIRDILRVQLPETLSLLQSIQDEQSLYRYAPEKWSIRELLGHVNDCERLYLSRAFWFARGFDTDMPSFDQNVAVAAARSDDQPWKSLIEDFRAVREATLTFYDTLPSEAWRRRGIASGNPFTVRALAYIAAGHVTHHSRILQTRYLQQ